eukprot:CAMPEP_0178443820 /NCGR_PEP_ID=MMETSP0689_2-20121128/39122_1 /TAXON_ID=160604 /ORGANISM="Amphidinium massartii, Strain CS-259" /LENGTH=924 /DNA_ID=CAMNT_0020067899 /DNA_START=80 /DNA_END=2855 /DNA_ORIENTATION=+
MAADSTKASAMLSAANEEGGDKVVPAGAFTAAIKDELVEELRRAMQERGHSHSHIGLKIAAEVGWEAAWNTVNEQALEMERRMLRHTDLKELKGLCEPLHPVLLVPGFCSSKLQILETDTRAWKGQRIWLDLNKLGFSLFSVRAVHDSLMQAAAQTFRKMFRRNGRRESQETQSAPSAANLDEEAAELVGEQVGFEEDMKNNWIRHMNVHLDADNTTWRDPPGIKVRVYENKKHPRGGLEAIDYLAPGIFTNEATYVFGPIISLFRDVGFIEGRDLQAAPYDFRFPPKTLEERDNYFSSTLDKVEQLCKNNGGRRTVIIAHSLGCRVVQFFLHWAEQQKGREWIDEHIELFLPIGGPFLGAPKTLRGLFMGEKLGLDLFLSDEQALMLNRCTASLPWIFPPAITHPHILHEFAHSRGQKAAASSSWNSRVGVLNVRNDTLDEEYDQATARRIFELEHLDHYWKAMQANFGEQALPADALIGPPPVRRVLHCHGYGLKTEVAYFFKKKDQKRGVNAQKLMKEQSGHLRLSASTVLELDPLAYSDELSVVDGIGYEVEEKEVARCDDEIEPLDGRSVGFGVHHCGHSGDGTVPYHSLSFSRTWTGQNGIQENRVVEMEGAEHRALLRDPRLHMLLLNECCLFSTFTGTSFEDRVRLGRLSVRVLNAWLLADGLGKPPVASSTGEDSASNDAFDSERDAASDRRRRKLWRKWTNPAANRELPRLAVDLQLGKQRWSSDIRVADLNGQAVWHAEQEAIFPSESKSFTSASGLKGNKEKPPGNTVEGLAVYDRRQRLNVRLLHRVKHGLLRESVTGMTPTRKQSGGSLPTLSETSGRIATNSVGAAKHISDGNAELAGDEELLALDRVELEEILTEELSAASLFQRWWRCNLRMPPLAGSPSGAACGVALEFQWCSESMRKPAWGGASP